MKVIVQVTKEDLVGYAVTHEELHDWITQAMSHSVDTWDGGIAFLDGPDLSIEICEVDK